MELLLLVLIALLAVANLLLLFRQKNTSEGKETQAALIKFEQLLTQLEKQVKDDFQRNRDENQSSFKRQREELTQALNQFGERYDQNSKRLNDLLKERFVLLNEKHFVLLRLRQTQLVFLFAFYLISFFIPSIFWQNRWQIVRLYNTLQSFPMYQGPIPRKQTKL